MEFFCPVCEEKREGRAEFCLSCGNFIKNKDWRRKENGVFLDDTKTKNKPRTSSKPLESYSLPTEPVRRLKEVKSGEIIRIPSGIAELDRVLGGGFVPSEVVLLASYPGTGKSTLCLSVAEEFSKRGKKVLYCSGEESSEQISLRAKRMGVNGDRISLSHSVNVEELARQVNLENPDLLIVDSIQKMYGEDFNGLPGSISQGSKCTDFLTDLTKKNNFISILISQVSKSGEFSGSESIQHAVDATLMFESDENTRLKFLRPVKNRFGDTGEIGVFVHEDDGIKSVSDPSGFLIDEDEMNVPGASLAVSSEGVRQISVEVQALISSTNLPTPRRQFNGVDYNRTQIIIGVLGKYCSKGIGMQDIFVSTLGAMKVKDPLCDLAIASAIYSSYTDSSLDKKTAFIGEISLTGSVRGGMSMQDKLNELSRRGVEQVYLPKGAKIKTPKDMKVRYVNHISEIKDIFS